MGRTHAVATIIKDTPHQESLGLHARYGMMRGLLRQLGLDVSNSSLVEDRRLLARQDLALEHHLANVEPVAEQIGEGASREPNPADLLSRLQGAPLCDDALTPQVRHEQVEAAELRDSAGR